MALDLQIVVDSAQPHLLADWWADALGWEVEPSDEGFIRKMIDQGYASEEDTTTHRGVLVWRTAAAIVHPGGRDQRPAADPVPAGAGGQDGQEPGPLTCGRSPRTRSGRSRSWSAKARRWWTTFRRSRPPAKNRRAAER